MCASVSKVVSIEIFYISLGKRLLLCKQFQFLFLDHICLVFASSTAVNDFFFFTGFITSYGLLATKTELLLFSSLCIRMWNLSCKIHH